MGLGDWIKDNKQGVLGGLELVGGIGAEFFAPGNPVSTALIGGGVSNITGEISHDRADASQANQQELYKQQLEQQQANKEYQLRRQQAISQNSINARGYTNTGTVFALGGSMLNPYTKSDNPLLQYKGAKHEQGGIQLANGAEVEGGETSNNGYVYSDRLKPKGSKKTFAQLSKEIEKRFSLRPNDKTDKIAKQRALDDLARQQEEFKKFNGIDNDGNKFWAGGKTEGTLNLLDDPTNPPGGNVSWQDVVNSGKQITDFSTWDVFDPAGTKITGVDKAGWKLSGATGEIGKKLATDGNKLRTDLFNSYLKHTGVDVTKLPQSMQDYIFNYHNKNGAPYQKGYLSFGYNKTIAPTTTVTNMGYTLPKFTPMNNTIQPTTNSSSTTVETPPGDGIGSIGAGIISGLPDVLAGVGTALLSSKVDYPELQFNPTINQANAYQMNPALVDPREQIRQTGLNFGATNEAIRRTSSGSGNYMSNRIASGIAQSEADSKIYNGVNGINTGILNNAKQFNARQAQQGSQFNAGQMDKAENLQFKTDYYNNALKQQEISDKLGIQMNGINLIANGLNTGIKTYLNEKEFGNMMSIAGGDNFSYQRIGNKQYKSFQGQGYNYLIGSDGKTYYTDTFGKPISEADARKLAAAYKAKHS